MSTSNCKFFQNKRRKTEEKRVTFGFVDEYLFQISRGDSASHSSCNCAHFTLGMEEKHFGVKRYTVGEYEEFKELDGYRPEIIHVKDRVKIYTNLNLYCDRIERHILATYIPIKKEFCNCDCKDVKCRCFRSFDREYQKSREDIKRKYKIEIDSLLDAKNNLWNIRYGQDDNFDRFSYFNEAAFEKFKKLALSPIKKLAFNAADVFYFDIDAGKSALPNNYDPYPLGMKLQHFSDESYNIDDHEKTKRGGCMLLSEEERQQIYKESGIEEPTLEDLYELEAIALSGYTIGCTCIGDNCNTSTCSCYANGIGCMHSSGNDSCTCSRKGCNNKNGNCVKDFFSPEANQMRTRRTLEVNKEEESKERFRSPKSTCMKKPSKEE